MKFLNVVWESIYTVFLLFLPLLIVGFPSFTQGYITTTIYIVKKFLKTVTQKIVIFSESLYYLNREEKVWK